MAGGMREILEKEFARLRKASGSVEVHLKSAADEVAMRAIALEKVLSMELAPNAAENAAKNSSDAAVRLSRQLRLVGPLFVVVAGDELSVR